MKKLYLKAFYKNTFYSNTCKKKSEASSYINDKYDKIMPFLISILQNYFPTNDRDQLAVIIYAKNYFNTIFNENEINSKKKSKTINKYLSTLTPYRLESLDEVIISLLTYLNRNYSEKVKDLIKYLIKILIALRSQNISGEIQLNQLYNRILSQLSTEIANYFIDNTIDSNTLINYFHIYECLLNSKKDIKYDDVNFETSLFLFEFAINNIDNINFENQKTNQVDDYLVDTEEFMDSKKDLDNKLFLIKRNKFNILKYLVDILQKLTENNLSVIKHTNDQEMNFNWEGQEKKFFLNNKKFIRLLEFFLYLDYSSFIFDPSNYQSLIFFETSTIGGTNLCEIKNILISKIMKKSLSFLFENSNYNLCPEFVHFSIRVFSDYLKCLNFFNKDHNIALVKDLCRSESEFYCYYSSIYVFLIECLNFNQIQELVKANQLEIFRYVIMPTLKRSISEKEAFFMDVQEYIRIIYDYTFNQKMKLIKTKGILLMLKLCDMFEEFINFVAGFYIEILIHTLKKEFSDGNLDKEYLQFENNFKYIYLDKINKTIFFDYIDNDFSSEDLFEQSFQILGILQNKLNQNNKNLFYQLNNIFYIILPQITQNNNEFIRSKICTFCYSSVRIQLSNHNDNSNVYQINSSSLENNTLYGYTTYIFDNFFYNITPNKNFALNFLSLEFINDLLFDISFMSNELIKKFLTNFILLNIPNFQKLIQMDEKNEISNNPNFHKFIINLVKNYYKQLENEIYFILNYLVNCVTDELEKKSNRTLSMMLDVITTIYLIVKHVQNSTNGILRLNVYNKVTDSLIKNCHRFLKLEYEEGIIKVCNMVLFFQYLNQDLFLILVENYFKNIINNVKFDIKEYHINFMLGILRIVLLSNKMELIFNYADQFYNFITRGIEYVEDNYGECSRKQFLLLNFLIGFISLYINKFSDYGFDPNDCEIIIQLLANRVKHKSSNIYKDTFAARLFLTFQIITLMLEENLIKIFEKNENFIYLTKKNLEFCGDHPTIIENNISILYGLKIIVMIYENNSCSINKSEIFDLIKEHIIFITEQMACMTYKNIDECENFEYKMGTRFGKQIEKKSINLNYMKNNYKYLPKKLIGLKNKDKDYLTRNENEDQNENENIKISFNDAHSDDEFDDEFDDEYESEESEKEEIIHDSKTNCYLNLNDDHNDDDDENFEDLFSPNLNNIKESELFNKKMTAEKFLKRKRTEFFFTTVKLIHNY